MRPRALLLAFLVAGAVVAAPATAGAQTLECQEGSTVACALPESTNHTVVLSEPGGGVFVVAGLDCDQVTQRSGQATIGCPGDTYPDPTDLGLEAGTIGVGGFGTLRFVTAVPVAAIVALQDGAQILELPPVPGAALAQSVQDTVLGAWPIFAAMSAFVVGLVVFRRVRR